MSRQRQLVAGLVAVLVLVLVFARYRKGPTRGRGKDPGTYMNNRGQTGALSPDYLPAGYQHLAQPVEIGGNVWMGPHALNRHPRSCSPNWSRVQADGWAWMFDPPSEESL